MINCRMLRWIGTIDETFPDSAAGSGDFPALAQAGGPNTITKVGNQDSHTLARLKLQRRTSQRSVDKGCASQSGYAFGGPLASENYVQ